MSGQDVLMAVAEKSGSDNEIRPIRIFGISLEGRPMGSEPECLSISNIHTQVFLFIPQHQDISLKLYDFILNCFKTFEQGAPGGSFTDQAIIKKILT
eukprot:14950052-Ditylum_brightwellii.AAC.1